MQSIRVGPDDLDRVRGVPRNFSLGIRPKAESGMGFLERGQRATPSPPGFLGERCEFSTIISTQDGLS